MFSPTEMPCDYMRRAADAAQREGEQEVTSLFLAFAREWDSHEDDFDSYLPMSWRVAKVSPTGRAVINLAMKYVNPKGVE